MIAKQTPTQTIIAEARTATTKRAPSQGATGNQKPNMPNGKKERKNTMAKATKSTQSATTTKTVKSSSEKKSTQGRTSSKKMTYPQAVALRNAFFHSNHTKADMSELLDKVIQGNKKPMSEEAKKSWLEKSGKEHCSYAQCKTFAFTLLKQGYDYDQVSALIDKLDKASGYQRQPKAEKVAEKGNKTAKENAPKGQAEAKKEVAKA